MQRKTDHKRCVMCDSELPKYKCPRCTRSTCSVKCVNDHKASFKCSGKLRSVRWVSKSDYDEKAVLEDYTLLEKAAQARNRARHLYRQRAFNPSKSFILKRACYKRGIQLLLAPPVFQRNEVNKSYFNKRMDTIFWYMEFNLKCNSSQREYCGTFPEGIKLSTALKKVVCSMNDATTMTDRRELAPFYTTQVEQLCCFLEVLHNRWTSDKRFYRLEINESIMKNLRNKVVIEYPTIHVCLPSSAHLFPQLTDEVKLSVLKAKNWERIPVERSVGEITSFMEEEIEGALYSRACKLNGVEEEQADESSLEEGEFVEHCPPRLVQLKPSDWRPRLSSRKPTLSVQQRRAMKVDMVMRLADEISKSQQVRLSEENIEGGQQCVAVEPETRSQVRRSCAGTDYFGLTDDVQNCALPEHVIIQDGTSSDA
ncbi:HIT zinc finger [Trichuris suis]|nr:HIT zinc finger [Trichuris suis]